MVITDQRPSRSWAISAESEDIQVEILSIIHRARQEGLLRGQLLATIDTKSHLFDCVVDLSQTLRLVQEGMVFDKQPFYERYPVRAIEQHVNFGPFDVQLQQFRRLDKEISKPDSLNLHLPRGILPNHEFG